MARSSPVVDESRATARNWAVTRIAVTTVTNRKEKRVSQ